MFANFVIILTAHSEYEQFNTIAIAIYVFYADVTAAYSYIIQYYFERFAYFRFSATNARGFYNDVCRDGFSAVLRPTVLALQGGQMSKICFDFRPTASELPVREFNSRP